MSDPIQATVVGPVTIITFRDGRLIDRDQIDTIRRALHRLIDAGHRNLLFDLGGVESIASRMLGVLLGSKRRAADSLPQERSAGLPPSEVIPLDGGPIAPTPQRSRVFEVYPDRESAVRVLAEAGPGHGWVALCAARPEIRDIFRVC